MQPFRSIQASGFPTWDAVGLLKCWDVIARPGPLSRHASRYIRELRKLGKVRDRTSHVWTHLHTLGSLVIGVHWNSILNTFPPTTMLLLSSHARKGRLPLVRSSPYCEGSSTGLPHWRPWRRWIQTSIPSGRRRGSGTSSTLYPPRGPRSWRA